MSRSITKDANATIFLVLAMAGLGVGCISLENEVGTDMCVTDSNCDTGEQCYQGTCYGNPPDLAPFAAVLVPPAGSELVETEVSSLDIATNGLADEFQLVEPVTLSGQVVLDCDQGPGCGRTPVLARISVRRPSRIPGGPELQVALETVFIGPTEPNFVFRLPPTKPGDAPYVVTVHPDDGSESGVSPAPAELAPPLRFLLEAKEDQSQLSWVLGNPLGQKTVAGRVLNAVGVPQTGMRVWALGRWTPGGPLTRGSSLAITDNKGKFALEIPLEMSDAYDIVVRPPIDRDGPSLQLAGVITPDPDKLNLDVDVGDLSLPSYGEPILFVVPVSGVENSGATGPIAGAEVRLRTILQDDQGTLAVYETTGFTNAQGEAEVKLIPGGVGNRSYDVQVLSPPASIHASRYQWEMEVGIATEGKRFLSPIVLDRREPVSGIVYNADGEPVEGTAVSAALSPAFLRSIPEAFRDLVRNLQFPSTTTSANGEFVLWLDPQILTQAASYDLEVIPPFSARAPRWTIPEVRAEDQSTSGQVSVRLPRASYARGLVVGPAGKRLVDAEFRLYELRDEKNCLTANGDAACLPAKLRGLWRSDEGGEVRVVLPAGS